MTSTLTTADIRRVRSLLRAGFRHTEISRETGWSPWTIGKIAADRRFLRTFADDSDLLVDESLEDDAPPEFVAKNLHRCSACGGTIYLLPCLTCKARAELQTQAAEIKAFAETYEPPEEDD